jgi:hypothetical protein
VRMPRMCEGGVAVEYTRTLEDRFLLAYQTKDDVAFDAALAELREFVRGLATIKDSHKLAMAQMQYAQSAIKQLQKQLANRIQTNPT